MTQSEFDDLEVGDILQYVHSNSGLAGHTWMVSNNYGDRITLVETCDATNPAEWKLVKRATYEDVY